MCSEIDELERRIEQHTKRISLLERKIEEKKLHQELLKRGLRVLHCKIISVSLLVDDLMKATQFYVPLCFRNQPLHQINALAKFGKEFLRFVSLHSNLSFEDLLITAREKGLFDQPVIKDLSVQELEAIEEKIA